MARVDYALSRRSAALTALLEPRRVVGSGLVVVLAAVVLGRAAGGPERVTSWLVASVMLAFAGTLIAARYRAADGAAEPYLIALRLALVVGLLGVLYQSRTPGFGLGVHRGMEATAIVLALIALCALAGDPRRHDAFQWIVLGCFATIVAVFFYHSLSVAEESVRSRHPLWWSAVAGTCLAVLPAYVSREAFLWAANRLAAALVALAVPVYVLGEYSLFGLQFTFHGEYAIPLLEYEVRATRSLFVNRNEFALAVFAGFVAAVTELHRALATARSRPIVTAAVPGLLFAVNAVGLAIAYGRALWVITPVALGIYVAYLAIGREAIPIAAAAGFAYLATGIAAVHSGLLGLPEGTPTRMERWYPALEAVLARPSLLGEGLIAPGQFVADHDPDWTSGSPHNSYLSIWIRTGVVGGVAYLVLVGASLLRGMVSYRDVDVGVLALVAGFAAHQLFEAYTLFQTGTGSVLAGLAIGMLVFGGRPGVRGGTNRSTPPDS